MNRQPLILAAALALAFAIGCSEAPQPEPPPAVSSPPEKVDDARLTNAYRLHPKVISGGEPADEAAFAALRELGVKTIISVDGAKPRLELAGRYGLRYVHLPHGYNGIPPGRRRELAKAVADLPGPIYIHCHHGKHRSPAAASVACIAAGMIRPEQGLDVLRAAGTSKDYRGLYQSVETAQPLDPAELERIQVEFREMVELAPLAEAMVAIEHTHDHLKTIAAAGWSVPSKHPDLDPAHEALLMKEHYTELLRTDDAQSQPPCFGQLLHEGEAAAGALQAALRAWKGAATNAPAELDRHFTVLSATCANCHREFRDIPLDKKREE